MGCKCKSIKSRAEILSCRHLVLYAYENLLKPVIWIDVVSLGSFDNRIDYWWSLSFCLAIAEKPVFSAYDKRLYRPFFRIVCKLNFRIFKKSFKRYPLIQDIADCSACQTFGQSSPLVFFAEFEKFFYLIRRIFLPDFCGFFKSAFPFFSGIFRVNLLKCKDFLRL